MTADDVRHSITDTVIHTLHVICIPKKETIKMLQSINHTYLVYFQSMYSLYRGVPGRGLCPLERTGPQYTLLVLKGDKKGCTQMKNVTIHFGALWKEL